MNVVDRSMPIAVLSLVFASLAQAETNAQAVDAELSNIPEWHGIALWSHDNLGWTLVNGMVAKGQGKGGAQLRLELKLTSDQRSSLKELLAKPFKSAEKDRTSSPEQFFESCETAVQEGLPAILTKPQLARFEELLCQIEGLAILRIEKYASRMGLTDDQQTEIKALLAKYREKARQQHGAIFTARNSVDARPYRDALKSLANELDLKILELLSEKQRVAWIGFVGARFDWDDVIGVPDDVASP
jgi:hypothetical protein